MFAQVYLRELKDEELRREIDKAFIEIQEHVQNQESL